MLFLEKVKEYWQRWLKEFGFCFKLSKNVELVLILFFLFMLQEQTSGWIALQIGTAVHGNLQFQVHNHAWNTPIKNCRDAGA